MVNATPARDVILKSEIPNLDLIPSHIDLVGAEIEMINYPNRESVLKGFWNRSEMIMNLSLSTVLLHWV